MNPLLASRYVLVMPEQYCVVVSGNNLQVVPIAHTLALQLGPIVCVGNLGLSKESLLIFKLTS